MFNYFTDAIEDVQKRRIRAWICGPTAQYRIETEEKPDWIVQISPTLKTAWIWLINKDLPEYMQHNVNNAVSSRLFIEDLIASEAKANEHSQEIPEKDRQPEISKDAHQEPGGQGVHEDRKETP